ncbi:MAG: flotillin family protein [Dehalococcoidia bacterium]
MFNIDFGIGFGFGIGIIAVALVLTLLVLLSALASRYHKAGPDEILVVSGRRRRVTRPDGSSEVVGWRVIRNGGGIVLPVLEQIGRLSLHVMSATVGTHNAISKEGVPLTVEGTALFKVGSSDGAIVAAAERYLGRAQKDIEVDVQAVLEGSLRSICGRLTPEEIYQDRTKFQEEVARDAQAELGRLGIELDTFTLREINDAEGYLDALGDRRTAEVKRDARVGIALAEQQAAIAEAEAKQRSEVAQATAEAEIAEAVRDRDVRVAKADADRRREIARAEQAGFEAQAEAEQAVADASSELARRRAIQRRAELEAEVVAIAEADRERQRIQAEAARDVQNAQTDAARYRIEAEAAARAEEVRKRGEAEADQTRLVGLAQAEAAQANLIAEAEGLSKKASALKEFNDAARELEIATALIQILPQMMSAAASPLSQVQEIRLVDLGGRSGADGQQGGPIDRLLNITPQTLGALNETLSSLLGVNLNELLSRTSELIGTDRAPADGTTALAVQPEAEGDARG